MTELINGFTGFAQRKAEQASRACDASTPGAAMPGAATPSTVMPGAFERDKFDTGELGGNAFSLREASTQGSAAYDSANRPLSSYGKASALTASTRLRQSAEVLDQIPGNNRRWAWAEIDLNAISHNVHCARRAAGAGTRVMAVLKNDAFGHGIEHVGKAVVRAGAEYVGVATIDEAIVLREAGVDAPVLLLSQPPAEAIGLLIAHKIMPSVYSTEFAITYGEMADRYGATAPYHLVIDTGMNCIGIAPSDALEFMQHTSFHRALQLDGVYTQLATSAEPETYELAHQFRRFVSVVSTLHNAGFDTGIVHCADTAASLRFPDSCLHMVRWGQGIYGIQPCSETYRLADLRPAMSVRARIVDLRKTPMSEGVSFGAHYRSAGNALICTLPIGYANGLPFSQSGRIDVLYDGSRCGQVGDICMDHCMFEVDMRTSTSRALHQPQRGDEVVLVGRQGDLSITLEGLARQSGNTPAGLACAFGARLPRVYV